MKITKENLMQLEWKEKKQNFVYTNGKSWSSLFLHDECLFCKNPFINTSNHNKFCDKECFDNYQRGKKIKDSVKENMSKSKIGHEVNKETREKIRKALTGKSRSKKVKDKMSKIQTKLHGGFKKLDVVPYDKFAQLLLFDETRANLDKIPCFKVLEVKCQQCNKWFIPNRESTFRRIKKQDLGLSHFYCSNECKNICPIFRQVSRQSNAPKSLHREVQAELRELVLERDNYICQKCEVQKTNKYDKVILHCHHYEGILWNPLEFSDIDACVTLCKQCHKEVHLNKGCYYSDMRCKIKNNIKDGKNKYAS